MVYFQLIGKLGVYDTLWALILTYAAIHLLISVFLFHGFMGTVPKDHEKIIQGLSTGAVKG